jgi:hypothetical protein
MTLRTSNKTFTHNSSLHFRYQKLNKPWYGPIKKAFEAFQKAQQYPSFSEEQFLDYLDKNYPDIYQKLEWVTFQSFHIRKSEWRGLQLPADGFKFQLARANIMPDPKIRRKLFEQREKITAETGWLCWLLGSSI